MKAKERVAILEYLRENIPENGDYSLGLCISALSDAITCVQEHAEQKAHLHTTERGSIWLIGRLTVSLAGKLGFGYSFSEKGCNYYSRCVHDSCHREFVIVDNDEISWLDDTSRR